MYYHVRLDMIRHDGRANKSTQVEWDFRSLHKALEFIKRDFGLLANSWRIQDLTEGTDDVLKLETDLEAALASTFQYVVLSFKDDAAATREYDHIEFFVVVRDEKERTPSFSFSEETEQLIDGSKPTGHSLVDFYKAPIDATTAKSALPLYDDRAGLFKGMVVQLKNGKNILMCAGIDDDEKSFNLGLEGVDKSAIKKIVPSTPDGKMLHGFIVRLTTGESLYLTIGKVIEKSANATDRD